MTDQCEFSQLPLVVDAECYTGQLRLQGGANETIGRLEICIGGWWGTVCDVGWRQDSARGTCQELGFMGGGMLANKV